MHGGLGQKNPEAQSSTSQSHGLGFPKGKGLEPAWLWLGYRTPVCPSAVAVMGHGHVGVSAPLPFQAIDLAMLGS